MAKDDKKTTPAFKLTIGKKIKGKLTWSRKDDSRLEVALAATKSALNSGAREVIISVA